MSGYDVFQGDKDDLHVQPHASRMDISQVPRQGLAKTQEPAAVYLSQSSDARLAGELIHLFRCVIFYDIRRLGARPNQPHVADEDAPQVRQLVHRERAQGPPDARNPWIVVDLEIPLVELAWGELMSIELGKALPRVLIHGPKLHQAEI